MRTVSRSSLLCVLLVLLVAVLTCNARIVGSGKHKHKHSAISKLHRAIKKHSKAPPRHSHHKASHNLEEPTGYRGQDASMESEADCINTMRQYVHIGRRGVMRWDQHTHLRPDEARLRNPISHDPLISKNGMPYDESMQFEYDSMFAVFQNLVAQPLDLDPRHHLLSMWGVGLEHTEIADSKALLRSKRLTPDFVYTPVLAAKQEFARTLVGHSSEADEAVHEWVIDSYLVGDCFTMSIVDPRDLADRVNASTTPEAEALNILFSRLNTAITRKLTHYASHTIPNQVHVTANMRHWTSDYPHWASTSDVQREVIVNAVFNSVINYWLDMDANIRDRLYVYLLMPISIDGDESTYGVRKFPVKESDSNERKAAAARVFMLRADTV